MKLALVQENFIVGDIGYNAATVVRHCCALRGQADLVVFSELALCGYPPEDLLLIDTFICQLQKAAQKISQQLPPTMHAVIGAPWQADGCLFNAALHITGGKIADVYYKRSLPNYGVFDEKRYFERGKRSGIFRVGDCRIGITVCEDIWHPELVACTVADGAEIIVNISASPYDQTKHQTRHNILSQAASTANLPVAYVNQVGAQDGLVFDGDSSLYTADGLCVFRCPPFSVGSHVVEHKESRWHCGSPATRRHLPDLWQALTIGISDYVHKNHFRGVVVAVSGGIDSALVLALAVAALGKDKVSAVFMPSAYTRSISREGAAELCWNLAVPMQEIPIDPICRQMLTDLSAVTDISTGSVTHQNLQARVRGDLIMALANQYRRLVLATSNKSEAAVGYATLYGDMCGALAPLLDVYKSQVYELARCCNREKEIIPQRIIDRAPSAELAEQQLDSDSLPAYPRLDAVLAGLLEERMSVEAVAAQGGTAISTVKKVADMLTKSEYKRRQAPPGIKTTALSFGKERRYPISSGFSLQEKGFLSNSDTD